MKGIRRNCNSRRPGYIIVRPDTTTVEFKGVVLMVPWLPRRGYATTKVCGKKLNVELGQVLAPMVGVKEAEGKTGSGWQKISWEFVGLSQNALMLLLHFR